MFLSPLTTALIAETGNLQYQMDLGLDPMIRLDGCCELDGKLLAMWRSTGIPYRKTTFPIVSQLAKLLLCSVLIITSEQASRRVLSIRFIGLQTPESNLVRLFSGLVSSFNLEIFLFGHGWKSGLVVLQTMRGDSK